MRLIIIIIIITTTTTTTTISHSTYIISVVYRNPSQPYAAVLFRNVRRKSIFAQVGIECVCVCMFLKESPIEIRTVLTHNLIGRSMTAPPPVLSLSSILGRPSPICAIVTATKVLASFKRCYYSILYILKNLVSPKLRSFKMYAWGTVCNL